MKVIPAVDIMGGECVQLVGGDPKTKKVYGDPVEMAKKWVEEGGRMLHVVDLDAALGLGENLTTIKSIRAETSVPIFVGGGVRDEDKVHELMELGIDKIILGTVAVEDIVNDFEFLESIINGYWKGKFICSVDSKKGYVVTKGWTEKTKIKTEDAVAALEPYFWGFLYTDVDVEGKMKGTRIKNISRVLEATSLPVIASGGISTKKEINELRDAGVWGAIVGKALYEGKIKPDVLGEYK